MAKKLKVTYFSQSINDYGYPIEGTYETTVERGSKRHKFYKEAFNGKSFGGEYLKTISITNC